MSPTEVIKVLGGRRVLGGVRDELGLENKVREGLPFQALEQLMWVADLDRETAARVTGIPFRTLNRRKRANALTFEESDRVAQFAEVFAYAVTVLGDKTRAARWLHTKSPYLGGIAPIDRLDNSVGRNAVRSELSRIAYGMLA